MTAVAAMGRTRIEQYRAALRAMRCGDFAFAVEPDADDALGLLGRDIRELAATLNQRFSEMSSLQSIVETVEAGLFLDDVLERVYESFQTIIPYDRIGCALLSRDRRTLTARWARTKAAAPAIRAGFSQPVAGSSLEAILRTEQPRILNDLEDYLARNPNSVSTRLILAEGVRSSLTCPLVAQGTPVGFLFFSSRAKHTYRDVHQGMFIRIAGQLSVVVEKSLLYEEVFRVNQELLEARQALEVQATHDALTGIPNRRAVLDRLGAELNRVQRGESGVGLLLCDIDHFKRINDTHGHAAGDAVLREVATTLTRGCRPTDTVARYGGEEFLVVLPAIEDPAELDTVAARLGADIAGLRLTAGDAAVPVTISIGGAIVAAGSSVSADTLIAQADASLYHAKEAGRNRYVRRPA
jgi:diguanylate cyclase (GGDEF)-like protein